jgi:hypothetical protein
MQAIKYLENPQEQSNLLDPKLKNVKKESLLVVCNVVSLCMEQAQIKRPLMQIITAMLEEGIDTSTSVVCLWYSFLCTIVENTRCLFMV